MLRKLMTATVALSALALCDRAVSGKVAMINLSTTQKAIQADAVVVGKVTEIEKDEVEVLPFPGSTDKVKMRVGVIKVDTGLVGAKNVTHVKVLLPAAVAEQPDQPLPGGPGIRPAIIRPGMNRQITLKEGEEGMFLSKHATAANYYALNMGMTPVEAKSATYKEELAKVKAVVATLSEPMTALKAAKVEDRLSAAATLIQKYRRGLPVPSKEEAIPAEETKAILKALVDADWTAADKPQPGQVIDYQAQPANIVNMIGLFPGSPNGLPQVQVKPGESYNAKFRDAFKAWYAKNGDSFQIKRFVPTGK